MKIKNPKKPKIN